MITVIDYGMGNLRSVQKAFERIGHPAHIVSNPDEIKKASKLILPGVGHFKKGMESLKESGVLEVLNQKVLQEKTPLLGICLGMQLFSKHSEEGDAEGLGWIDAQTIAIKIEDNPDKKFRIPHMGWNNLQIVNTNPLFDGVEKDALFYFVHSYHVVCKQQADVAAITSYGIPLVSSVRQGNIYGTQFHPEKSHKNGLKILKNFVEKI